MVKLIMVVYSDFDIRKAESLPSLFTFIRIKDALDRFIQNENKNEGGKVMQFNTWNISLFKM